MAECQLSNLNVNNIATNRPKPNVKLCDVTGGVQIKDNKWVGNLGSSDKADRGYEPKVVNMLCKYTIEGDMKSCKIQSREWVNCMGSNEACMGSSEYQQRRASVPDLRNIIVLTESEWAIECGRGGNYIRETRRGNSEYQERNVNVLDIRKSIIMNEPESDIDHRRGDKEEGSNEVYNEVIRHETGCKCSNGINVVEPTYKISENITTVEMKYGMIDDLEMQDNSTQRMNTGAVKRSRPRYESPHDRQVKKQKTGAYKSNDSRLRIGTQEVSDVLECSEHDIEITTRGDEEDRNRGCLERNQMQAFLKYMGRKDRSNITRKRPRPRYKRQSRQHDRTEQTGTHNIKVGQYNIQGGWENKKSEIKHVIQSLDLDVMGVTETEETRDDSMNIPGYYHSMVSRQGSVKGDIFRGVCTFVKNEMRPVPLSKLETGSDECEKWKWVGVRVGNVKLAITTVYLKSGGKAEANKANKKDIQNLTTECGKLASRGWLMCIIGDFNGHVGESIPGNHPKIDQTGKGLIEFMRYQDLVLVNGLECCEGVWTWTRRDQRSAIDFCFVSRALKPYIRKMTIDEHGLFEIGSDHNMFWVEFMIPNKSSGIPTAPQNTPKWNITPDTDWRKFRRELEVEYETRETAQMSPFKVVRSRDIEQQNEEVCTNMRTTAAKMIGKKRARSRGVGLSKDTLQRIKRRKTARRQLRVARKSKRPLQEINRLRAEYHARKREVRQQKDEEASKKEKTVLQSLQRKGKLHIGNFWKHRRSKRVNNQQNAVRKGTTLLLDPDDIKKHIEEYFGSLYKGDSTNRDHTQPPIGQTVRGRKDQEEADILQQPFTGAELSQAIALIKREKAVGTDDIPNEFLKEGGPKLREELLNLMNTAREVEKTPSTWRDSKTPLLFKKGVQEDLDNYRGLNINSNVGKLYTRMILGRMDQDVEARQLLGYMQHAFRQGWSAMEALFVLTQVVQWKQLQKQPERRVYLAFLDVSKAYDTVNRESLWRVLNEMGYGGKTTRVIKSLYTDLQTKVMFGDIVTDYIPIERGLKQGCVLSPILFSLYVRELSNRLLASGVGVNTPGVRIPGLFFADDIVLMADTKAGLQRLLDIAGEFADERGLKFNGKKSGVLTNDTENIATWTIQQKILTNGQEQEIRIEQQQEYKYLGVTVSLQGRMFRLHGANIVTKAKQLSGVTIDEARHSLNKVFVGKTVWKHVMLPALLYGAEVIVIPKGVVQQIQTAQNKVGRMILGLSDQCPKEVVEGELEWNTINEEIAKAKLHFYGHLMRLEESRWARRVMSLGNTQVKNRQTSWWTDMQEIIDSWDIDIIQVRGGKNMWKDYVRRKIAVVGTQRWKDVMETKSSLSIYKWKIAKDYQEEMMNRKTQLWTKLRANDVITEEKKANRLGGNPLCKLCRQENETVTHVILTCPAYYMMRAELFTCLRDSWSEVKWKFWLSRPEEHQVALILGLAESHTEELKQKIQDILMRIWDKRETVMDSRNPGKDNQTEEV